MTRPSRSYDLRALIEAYVDTKRQNYVHRDFGIYYTGLLSHLEQLFGIEFTWEGLTSSGKVLWSLFENTVRSLLQISTPWDTYLEAGLLHRKLEESGEPGKIVERASNTIADAAKISGAAHREMLVALFVAIFGDCDRVVSSEELLQAGFDDSLEPDISNYYNYM